VDRIRRSRGGAVGLSAAQFLESGVALSIVIVLSGKDLLTLLSPLRVVDAVAAAVRAQDAGTCIAPDRQHIAWRDNILLTMPAVGAKCFGVKLVTVMPGNAARGLPLTGGVMLLSDSETGLPLAALNAAVLTGIRTGGIGALGVQHMAAADCSSVGIVGCGVQATWQAIFACAVRPIRQVLCLCRSPARFETFAAAVKHHVPDANVVPCRDARELLHRTDLVIAATTSSEPVLPDEPALLKGKQFVSIGSYTPSMRELPDAVYRLAGQLAIDSPTARHEAGDVIHAVDTGLLEATDIFSLGQWVTGQRVVEPGRTSVFKSVGMALSDLFVAEMLLKTARTAGLGVEVSL
jgi:ornithine cyclodeaminase/alanine dehydrogenase-like protein (mu-crystallin family)